MAEIKAIGNIGADAQLRYTPSGSPVLGFRVCDSKSKKEGDDWKKVAEQWFSVSIWGSLAEFYAEKLLKGTRVEVIGEFYQRPFESRDGERGLSNDVKAWGVRILKAAGEGGQSQPQNTNYQNSAYGVPQSNQYPPQQQGGFGSPPQQGNTGGWGNQSPQQQQNAPQQQQQQGGGWNAPANDPWNTNSQPTWGNPQQ